MRVKISEVATAAGVSAATVSKVLSGRPGYTVNVSTAERVREAARTLGYVPDVAARNLRTRRTGQLGVILEAVGASEPEDLTDGVNAAAVRRTFDGAIMAGLSGAARDLGVPALVVYPGGNVPRKVSWTAGWTACWSAATRCAAMSCCTPWPPRACRSWPCGPSRPRRA
ncbi:LacI family DNA-binding transcriptional regulator [Deinococcus aquaticus]|uniref:LacI family DNA-binding transcriptional regulator n=1 Tax=Deinococcus aquaticus TaxID=328692 RepID=UPI003611478B